MRRGYSVTSTGKVSCCRPLTPGTSMDALIWDRKGPEQARGRFKDNESAHTIVHLVVRCLWEGGGV